MNHTAEDLKMMQSLPLSIKVRMTEERIRQWYQYWGGKVCVSFSGGKDSTVLMHIARGLYPDIPAVFSNTGLEYPEIQRFVREYGDVDIVTPKMHFFDVVMQYGFPMISKETAESISYSRRIKRGKECDFRRGQLLGQSYLDLLSGSCVRKYENGKVVSCKINDIKHGDVLVKSTFNKEKWLPICLNLPAMIGANCCAKIKKSPMKKYQSENGYTPILATLAEESMIRHAAWLKHGCNAFESKKPMSQPMSFWTEQDVLAYIVKNDLKIASVYGDIVSEDENGDIYSPTDLIGDIRPNLKCTGCDRTGCIFCGFGAHLEKVSRFERLAKTHPRQYEYCICGGQWSDNPHYDPAVPAYDGDWKNWNPKKIWTPSEKGLGMGKLFDMANEIMGKKMWRY